MTADQMLTANETFLSAGPFVLSKPEYRGFITPVMGESYLDSRALLGTLLVRSGMGVHLLWGPAIGTQAADPDDPAARGQVPTKMIMEFAQMTGATPPMNPWPVFSEFELGNPQLARVPAEDSDQDFAAFRCNQGRLTKLIVPAALGQTLFKQAVWSEDFFSGIHRDAGGQTLLGTDAGAGFSGLALTGEALNKLLALKTELAYDPASGRLGSVDLNQVLH